MVSSVLSKLGLGTAIAVGSYAVIIGLLLTPPIQRFAIYAHKVSTLFWDDLNKPESYGFAKNQVTPFTLATRDGIELYAWHILPLDVYARHEAALHASPRPAGPLHDPTQSKAFRLLTDDANARVVVNFHGNAGHIAQGYRPSTYHHVTTHANTHVLTIDYRGFGYSTGSPTEAGLILDGIALVDWLVNVANIPPQRIVVLGQSLGTAVASAVALFYAEPTSALIPNEVKTLVGSARQPMYFAGMILVAPFSSLPSLMLTYRIGGVLPLFLPLRPFPTLATYLTDQMVDKWFSAERLAAYYAAPLGVSGLDGRKQGFLQIIHAMNDRDITYRQTEMICRRIFGEGEEPGIYDDDDESSQTDRRKSVKCIDGSQGAAVLDVKAELGRPRVRFELVEHGGHNEVITFSAVGLALARAFEGTE